MDKQDLKEKIARLIYDRIYYNRPRSWDEYTRTYSQYYESAALILALIKAADYVQLDPDQSLPAIPSCDSSGIGTWSSKQCREAQEDMLKADFRKVRKGV